jgi:hypothetical protein
MSSSSLVRWGLWGALLAATAWTASGIVAFVFGVAPFGPVGSLSWYLIESSDAIAEAGMLMALVGLHVRQVANYGRLGMAGFIVAFVGAASSFVTTVIYILSSNGFETVVGVLQNLGILGWLVGFPLLEVRRDDEPRLRFFDDLLLIRAVPEADGSEVFGRGNPHRRRSGSD